MRAENHLKKNTLAFIIAFCLAQFLCAAIQHPTVKKGVLDLRNWDFSQHSPLELAGEWKFLWEKDIPLEYQENVPAKYIIQEGKNFTVPGTWNSKLKKQNGYGWFAVEIFLDNSLSGELGFHIQEVYTACEVYIDDELVLEYGKAGNTKEETISDFIPFVISLPQKDKIVLSWKISNFHYIFGGPAHSPRIGLLADIKKQYDYSRFIQTMLLGIMLIMAIYHIALWFERKDDMASLYFALFCLVIFFRTLCVNHFLTLFIPEATVMSMELSYKLNFLSFTLGPFFFAAFFRALFPQEFKELFMKIIFVYCIIGTLIILITPSSFYTSLLYVYLLLLALFTLSILISLFIAVLKKREAAFMMQVGFIIFIIASVHDVFYALKIIYTGRIIDFAMVCFIFVQSRALAFRYAKAFKTATYLSQNLQTEVDKKTSELKHREEELLKTNKKLFKMDKYKTEFFQNITHELQTPLLLILSPVDTLIKGMWGTLPQAANKQLTMIKRQSKRLLNLINQLLDLTRIDLGKEKLLASVTDMNHFLSSIFSQFEYLAESKGIDFTFRKPVHSPRVYIDREKMQKVFINLLSNAFKFTPDNGFISIKLVSRTAESVLDISWIDISIKDSGIGIHEDEFESIFERFHRIDNSDTRKSEGTGIGLSLVKEYVQLHHGNINVSSTPGKGSEFCVSLQMGRQHLLAEEIVDQAPEIEFEKAIMDFQSFEQKDVFKTPLSENTKILIIEDNEDLRKYLADLLKDHYSVHEASNGQKGLERAVELIPDLILCDIMMPEMDGLTLLEKLNQIKITENIPFIFLTAKKGFDDKLKGLTMGAMDYITKPFEIEELMAKIASLLKNRLKSREAHIVEMENRIIEKLAPNINLLFQQSSGKSVTLTKKESQMVEALKMGKTIQNIADEAFLSIGAIKKRLSKIYEKCGVKTKSELLSLYSNESLN